MFCFEAATILGRLEESKIEGSGIYWVPWRTTLSPNLLLHLGLCSEVEKKGGKYTVCGC